MDTWMLLRACMPYLTTTVMGDMDKSNELVDKCLEFADANQWCSFGYLAARVDKAARAK